ncbi:hypothetical protein GDO81_019798 [Engystomops pustulosus]|uniref:Secreted protein n=1 Tax=Engystomops pustulosus TaxID=76066 RepID=A0AAV6Z970_ENGPU|nr:hypothetical protein GDO81_019798 [Engystomops pustulosus]
MNRIIYFCASLVLFNFIYTARNSSPPKSHSLQSPNSTAMVRSPGESRFFCNGSQDGHHEPIYPSCPPCELMESGQLGHLPIA